MTRRASSSSPRAPLPARRPDLPGRRSRTLADVQAPRRRQGDGGRLTEQFVVGQPRDGESIVAVEDVTPLRRVVIDADPGEPEHLDVPQDGASADLQFRRQGHGVVAVPALEQFQELQDAGEAGRLAQPPIDVPSLSGITCGRFSRILPNSSRAVTHLCPASPV